MKNIYVIGSSLKDKGGIVTVMKNIDQSHLNEKYNFIHIDTYNTVNSLKKLCIYISGFIKVLFNMKKIDIAHIHISYKGSLYRKSLIIFLLKCFNKKTVLHMHGSCFKEFYNNLNKIGKKYCRFTLNKADNVIVLSQTWKDFFAEIVDKDKIVVIRNSVPVEENPPEKETKNNVCKFVFLGRLGKRKGVYDILDVSSKLLQDYKDFEIILAGDGEIEKVEEIIQKCNLSSNVKNIGWIDKEQKDKMLREADVFILPSYNEGMPMAILEAMSYGVPCIASNVGGIPEVIQHDNDGYLINPGDKEQLYFCMKDMMLNGEKRLEIGRKAFEKISSNFNQRIELEKLDDIYTKLI